jgi:hypothetical protein
MKKLSPIKAKLHKSLTFIVAKSITIIFNPWSNSTLEWDDFSIKFNPSI